MASVLLALAIAGFVGAFTNIRDVQSTTTEVEFLVFGSTALVTSYALWARRTWAHRAFVVWGFVAINGVVDHQIFGSRIAWSASLSVVALMMLLLILGARYIRKAADPSTAQEGKKSL